MPRTLEANAALRSIVRRDSEQGYEEFLMELAKASGIETPLIVTGQIWPNWTASARAKDRRVWKHPHDADASDYQNEGRADAPGAQGGASGSGQTASDCLGDGTGFRAPSRGHFRPWLKTLTEAVEKVRTSAAGGTRHRSRPWWPTRGITARSGWSTGCVGLRSYDERTEARERRWRGDRQGQEARISVCESQKLGASGESSAAAAAATFRRAAGATLCICTGAEG